MLSTSIVQLCYGKITVIFFFFLFFYRNKFSAKRARILTKCCALLAIIRPFCTDLQPCNNQPERILNVAGLALNLFWKMNVIGSNRGKYLLQSLYIFALFTVIFSSSIVQLCYAK